MFTSIPILGSPWVFGQSHLLSTTDLISEASRRGVHLDAAMLREAYRRGFLSPVAELTSRKVGEPVDVPSGPTTGGSIQLALGRALAEGRVRDPAAQPYRPRLRFDSRRVTDPRGWTNGLIYSRWQLLTLHDLKPTLPDLKRRWTTQSKEAAAGSNGWMEDQRKWALILMALEPRYLPAIDPEWLRLTNVDREQWEAFCAGFDVNVAIHLFAVTSEELRGCADRHLRRARQVDPTGDWSRLIRRAPRRSWESLKGAALIALDNRLAAEILLRSYEELADRGAAPPLPNISTTFWDPLSERISAGRSEPLVSRNGATFTRRYCWQAVS